MDVYIKNVSDFSDYDYDFNLSESQSIYDYIIKLNIGLGSYMNHTFNVLKYYFDNLDGKITTNILRCTEDSIDDLTKDTLPSFFAILSLLRTKRYISETYLGPIEASYDEKEDAISVFMESHNDNISNLVVNYIIMNIKDYI